MPAAAAEAAVVAAVALWVEFSCPEQLVGGFLAGVGLGPGSCRPGSAL